MAITLKVCLGGLSLLLKIVNTHLTNENKFRLLKHILALSIWSQKCVFSQLQPLDLTNFDLDHPVITKFC